MVAEADESVEELFPRLRSFGDRGYVKKVERARRLAHTFSRSYIWPRALEIDRKIGADANYFDWDTVREGHAYGMQSMIVPKLAGGTGASGSLGPDVKAAVIMEELSAGCPGVANVFGVQGTAISGLLMAGGVSHWEGVLSEIVDGEKRGEPILVAGAITEPGAGTDVEDTHLMRKAKISTVAAKVSGGYLLNGTKLFISNGSVARWVAVYMPTDKGDPAGSWTGFLVPADSNGFSVARVEHKVGQRACPCAELSFTDVFVPDEMVIGRQGDGMALTMMFLASSRSVIGAIATGNARGAYERLLEWSASDPAGRALRGEQHFQLALAEMDGKIRLARQMYMDAAAEFDHLVVGKALGHPLLKVAAKVPRFVRRRRLWRDFNNSASMRERVVRIINSSTDVGKVSRSVALSSLAKATCSQIAMDVTTCALNVVGLQGSPVLRSELEKLWRDAKVTQIYDGTSQLNMIEAYRVLCAGEQLPGVLPAVRRKAERPLAEV